MVMPITLKRVTNPYGTDDDGPIPTGRFTKLLVNLMTEVGEHLEKGHHDDPGAFPRLDFAVVMLDPTAPLSTPSEDAVLFTATFGEYGPDFLPNAAAKAYDTRDLGVEVGQAVYTARHLRRYGSFRYGFAPATLRGINIGGSGQTEVTDLKVCNGIGMRFDTVINAEISDWERHQGPGRWLSDNNKPAERYRAVVTLPGQIVRLPL